MSNQYEKYPVIAARVDKDTKDFFAKHTGLAAKVLKDFYNQWDAMMYRERKLEKKQAAEKKNQDK